MYNNYSSPPPAQYPHGGQPTYAYPLHAAPSLDDYAPPQAPAPTGINVPPGFTIDEGLRYGRMPHEMLAVKFEETDMGYDEGSSYNNYARSTLMDRGPDPVLMASDEPRRSDWSGRLNLQYYGHRGAADDPAHPEMFLGEIDADPRGHRDEPDIKRMRSQWESRGRFQRFTPDDQATTTGGGRSEPQLMRDLQSGFKWVRNRLKVFSRQLDGRRPGKQGNWKSVSRISRYAGHKSRIDRVADGVQQRNNIIETYSAIRDSKAYRDNTADQEMDVAILGQARKHGRAKNTQQRLHSISNDGGFGSEKMSAQFKTAANLLADIVKIRDRMVTTPRDHDGVAAETQIESMARKHADVAKDLAALMQSAVYDSRLGIGRETISMKTAAMTNAGPATGAPIVFNHLTPAHLLHVPELMYKAAGLAGDRRKVDEMAIRDGVAAAATIVGSIAKSAARSEDMSLASRQIVGEVKDRTMATYSYKQRKMTAPTAAGSSGENFAGKSDLSQTKKSRAMGGNPHGSEARERIISQAKFGGNIAPVRHGGRFGNKVMVRRQADRESSSSAMAEI